MSSLAQKKLQSTAILVLTAFGFGWMQYLLRQPLPSVAYMILSHGCEGGLVGGLCDWFAVWKTYDAVRKRKDQVADGIGEYLREELLSAHHLRASVHEFLDSPEQARRIQQMIQTHLANREEIKQAMERLWTHIEEDIIQWIVEKELNDTDRTVIHEAMRDGDVISATRFCLRQAAVAATQDEKFDHLYKAVIGRLPFSQMVKGVDWFADFKGKLRATLSNTEEGKPANPEMAKILHSALEVASLGVSSFITAWNGMPPISRRNATTALVRHLKTQVFENLSQLIADETDKLQSALTLRSYAPLRQSLEYFCEHIQDKHSAQVTDAMVNQLKRMDAKKFSSTFEEHTRIYLENIRLNGTLLGFVLGCALGGLIHYLQ